MNDQALSPINWQQLLSPRSVAVIGASNTRGSWGFTITAGLLKLGGRQVYAVNPRAAEVQGLKAYHSVRDIPGPVDLAVIVVAANMVPGVMKECAEKGVKTASIITAGFAEMGGKGQELETEVAEIASQAGIRFIGPNSMGHANTQARMSTFGQVDNMKSGPVSLISQSGSMTMGMVHALAETGISFSKYISSGNEANIHLEDYLEFLAADDNTRVIAAYVEGLREGRRFFNLAKEVTRKKPVIVLKAGGTEESARAVMSHTAALAGSDPVYEAAFKQSGVIRVEDDEEMGEVIFALLNTPLPRGKGAGILSIGGGPGAMAAEACEKEGLVIGKISEGTIAKMDACLPARWSRRNPCDLAGIGLEDYPAIATSLWALLDDDSIDIVLLQAPIVASKEILTGRMGLKTDEVGAYREKERENLRQISRKVEESGKPVVLLGQRAIRTDPELSAFFNQQKILAYSGARRAARIMRYLTTYRKYLDRVAGQDWPLFGK
ncbi:MAG: CoA-binding protein [Dehalococcoidales bacterium]|nr:CoA-binding protein [Dehalococcoidales bacterium]